MSEPQEPPPLPPVALAAEISQDRRRCAVAAAWRDPGGKVAVKVAWYGPPALAPAEVARLCAEREVVDVLVDGRSQSATLLGPLGDAGVAVRQPSTQEVVIAHGDFMDLVNGNGLLHSGQEELTAAVRAAVQRPLGGAQAWERRAPGADQAPLVAATLAVHGLLAWEAGSTPGAWVIGGA